jgi:hypothetical protein
MRRANFDFATPGPKNVRGQPWGLGQFTLILLLYGTLAGVASLWLEGRL